MQCVTSVWQSGRKKRSAMDDRRAFLETKARRIRYLTVDCIASLGVGHVGGALSIAEVLAVLYSGAMRVDPKEPHMEGRDRLVLSKGHAGPALYAALANEGYFPVEELHTLNQPGTHLPSHADMRLTTGVDMTAGSLGQGFSCAVGIAAASKLKGDGATVFTLIGDGESEEGTIWEAAMSAAHYRLDNLIGFTDYNKYQIDGTVLEVGGLTGLEDKWRAFGWTALTVDGHDVIAIENAVNFAKTQRSCGRPVMIILDTVKGKGVAYAERLKAGSHNFAIDGALREQILEELR